PPFLRATDPPASSSHSISAPAACMIRLVAAATSGPMPSPAIIVTVCVLPDPLLVYAIGVDGRGRDGGNPGPFERGRAGNSAVFIAVSRSVHVAEGPSGARPVGLGRPPHRPTNAPEPA